MTTADGEIIYRAASGAKVLTIDPQARTVTISTRHRGRPEIHTIAVDSLVKAAYGECAAVVILTVEEQPVSAEHAPA